MTTNYHTPIVTGATNAPATVNTPLSALDSAIASINSSVTSISSATGLFTAINNGAGETGTAWTVDDTTGFLAGMTITYTISTGVVKTNTIATVDSSTQITVSVTESGTLSDGAIVAAVAPGLAYPATQWHDIRNYGAVGDDSTDDSAAILAAITAAAATNGTVVVPPGTYKVTDRFALIDNTHILGVGGTIKTYRTTVDYTTGEAVDVTDLFHDGGTTVSNVSITNLIMVNAGADNMRAISGSFFNSVFAGNEIDGFIVGIECNTDSSAPPMDAENTDGPAYTTVIGVESRSIIKDNYIHDSHTSTRVYAGGSPAIYAAGGYCIISGNRIENTSGGILGPDNGIVANNRIVNVTNENGIYLSGSTYTTCTGNYVENTNRDGIALSQGKGCTISNNVIVSANQRALRIQNSTDCTWVGNVIYCNGVTSRVIARADSGIDGNRGITITGNIFIGPLAANTENVVDLDSGSTIRNKGILIANNVFEDFDCSGSTGNPSQGPFATIFVQDGNAKDVVVRNNTFRGIKFVPGNGTNGTLRYISSGCYERENVIELDDVDMSGTAFDWTVSGSGTNEYYCTKAGGSSSAVVTKPDSMVENSATIPEGTIGSLAAGEWAYGDNDALGFNTVYVRLTGETDPDAQASGFLSAPTTIYTGDGVLRTSFSINSSAAVSAINYDRMGLITDIEKTGTGTYTVHFTRPLLLEGVSVMCNLTQFFTSNSTPQPRTSDVSMWARSVDIIIRNRTSGVATDPTQNTDILACINYGPISYNG